MSMSKVRSEFLAAAENDDVQPFINMMHKHTQKTESFNVGELLATLDRDQLGELWTNLQMKATMALLSLTEEAENQEESLDSCGKLLEMIVIVAIETIKMKDFTMLETLYETVVLLNGILLSIPEEQHKLTSCISQLCEAWWASGLEGREALAPQTILYLLDRSLQPKSTKSDVKRVWKMHECLNHCELSDQLSTLVQLAATTALFLKMEEGKKLVTYLLGLSAEYIDCVHSAVRNILHTLNRAAIDAYGEIYFKAWRNSTGDVLKKLEVKCMQDFMWLAINVESQQVGWNIRQILSYIHGQKKERGVDEMLKRLYDPIIWRSLRVANENVRAAALSVLIDAFPLQDPQANAENTDALKQKQFDLLDELMMDPSPQVRAIACRGVCRILNLYWEMLPPTVIQNFVTKLANDMAWDGSSADVRCAVIKGFTHLLDNHLSHPLMRTVLPQLKCLLHDHSEKVRLTFIDLVIKVKGIRAIKFWHVAPAEHLLARMEMDSVDVTRRITSLLLNSYVPVDKSNDELLYRCVTLIKDNPMAARRFYHMAARNYLTVPQTSRFMVVICRGILQCVRDETARANAPRTDGTRRSDSGFVSADVLESFEEDIDGREDSGVEATGGNPEQQRRSAQSDEEDAEEGISLRDTELIVSLLDIVIILWNVIEPVLKKADYADIKDRLEQRFGVALPEYLRVFQNPTILSSLIILAGFLPPKAVPTLSRSLLSKLRGMTSQTAETDYAPMLHCMCQWSKADDILQLISDWLKDGLKVKDQDESTSKRASTGKSRKVMFQEPSNPQPLLALQYLSYMLAERKCRALVLATDSIHHVSSQLKQVTKYIEKRLTGSDELSEHATDDFLVQAFEMYLKLEILLHDSKKKNTTTHNGVKAFEHVIAWTDAEILFLFRKNAAKSRKKGRKLLGANDATLLSDGSNALATTQLGQTTLGATLSTTLLSDTVAGKRTAGDSNMAAVSELTTKLLESVLEISSEVMLIGMADLVLASHLADFSMQMLKLEESTQFLPLTTKLMYQIGEYLQYHGGDEEEDDHLLSPPDPVVKNMLNKLIEMLISLVKNNKEQAQRILPSIKEPVSEMLYSYYKQLSVSQTTDNDVISTIMAASLNEVSDVIKKDINYEVCICVTDLPPFSAFFLSLLVRRKQVASLYVTELSRCVKFPDLNDVYKMAACLHLIMPLTADKKLTSEVKECVNALQLLCENFQLPEDLSEESPSRHLLQQNKDILKDCMTKIGMVA